MITSETLFRCAFLGAEQLQYLIQKNYPQDQVLASELVGISNGGQFVYSIDYPEGNERHRTKVFVYERNDELVAEY